MSAPPDKSVALCFGSECRVCDNWGSAVAAGPSDVPVAIHIIPLQSLVLHHQLPDVHRPAAFRDP